MWSHNCKHFALNFLGYFQQYLYCDYSSDAKTLWTPSRFKWDSVKSFFLFFLPDLRFVLLRFLDNFHVSFRCGESLVKMLLLIGSSLEVAWYTVRGSTGTEERETSPRGKKQTSVSCFDAKNKKIFIFWWQIEIVHVLMKNCFFLCLYAKIRHFSWFCEKWMKFFMFGCKKEETFYVSM